MNHSIENSMRASRALLVTFGLSLSLSACGSDADGTTPGAGGAYPMTGGAGGITAGGTTGSGGVVGNGGGLATGGGGMTPGGSGGATAGSGCGASKTYACMAPPMLAPFPREAAGQWTYHEVEGTFCRDGSPAGFYTRFSDTSKKLLVYLEQGGACFNSALCMFNPASVSDSLAGRVLTEAISPGVKKGVKQVPQTTGIFDYANPENPYKDWNAVWVPYCTGDAYGGSNPSATVPGVAGTQKFVGYSNMQKFVGHIVPTWPDAERVVLTGTSAGSFGAGINYNQFQDAFGQVPVTLIMDSGLPFSDQFMAPCLQKTWRELWNLQAAIPPDCPDCTLPDSGGFLNLVFYTAKKFPSTKLGVISATEDDIMRFFFAFGENGCGAGGKYETGKYTQALADLRQLASPWRAQFASYYVPGIKHMYSQFDDFYQPMSGGVKLVSWVNDVLAGNMKDVGP